MGLKIFLFSLLIIYQVNAICPPGTIEGLANSGICYKIHVETDSWYDANTHCLEQGGQLASIKDGFTNTLISSTLSDLFGANRSIQIWLSGNRIGTNSWHWTDGTPFTYLNWATGNPKAPNTGSDCLAIQPSNRYWYSNNCSITAPSVCELASNGSTGATAPPNSSPAGSTQIGTNTTPGGGSTQGGGSCPTGWLYYAATNRCFTALNQSLPYTNANSTCISLGGNLASIHNIGENNFITSNFNGTNDQELNGDLFAFIGLFSANADGTWVWTDGTPYDFQNWVVSPPSPANYGLVLTSTLQAIVGKWYTLTIQNVQDGIYNNAICARSGNGGGTGTFPTQPVITTTTGTTTTGKPGTCPTGWLYYSGTNRCFTALNQSLPYTNANSTCISMGGNLASIHSIGENNFITTNFNGTNDQELNGDLFAFIGLYSANADGTWVWTDGTPYDFQNWVVSPPSPANYGLVLTSTLQAIVGKWYTLTIQNVQDGIYNNAICARSAG